MSAVTRCASYGKVAIVVMLTLTIIATTFGVFASSGFQRVEGNISQLTSLANSLAKDLQRIKKDNNASSPSNSFPKDKLNAAKAFLNSVHQWNHQIQTEKDKRFLGLIALGLFVFSSLLTTISLIIQLTAGMDYYRGCLKIYDLLLLLLAILVTAGGTSLVILCNAGLCDKIISIQDQLANYSEVLRVNDEKPEEYSGMPAYDDEDQPTTPKPGGMVLSFSKEWECASQYKTTVLNIFGGGFGAIATALFIVTIWIAGIIVPPKPKLPEDLDEADQQPITVIGGPDGYSQSQSRSYPQQVRRPPHKNYRSILKQNPRNARSHQTVYSINTFW